LFPEILSQIIDLLVMNFWVIILGSLIGIFAGAIPGFSAANTLVILLPFTLVMNIDSSLLMMMAIFAGVRTGGAFPAILIRMPGTGSASVTTFDGYPMAEQGKANQALGISIFASFLGGTICTIIALCAAPLIGRYALKLNSVDICVLTIVAIGVVGQITGGSVIKGWLSGLFGLLCASIGMDKVFGTPRFTFDSMYLMDGISIIPPLVGLFALSETLVLIEREYILLEKKDSEKFDSKTVVLRIKEIIEGGWLTLQNWTDAIRSSIIGVFIGALPGAGANIASFLAYQLGATFSRERFQFGKGAPAGVVCAETADNGVSAGAMIPLLTIGIPGSSSTAVMLVVMIANGLNVGPRLFADNPVEAYSTLAALLLANFWVLIFGITMALFCARLIEIPTRILAPVIMLLCLAGSFANRGWIFDIYLTLIFAAIGYIMRKSEYPPQAALLGIILGPITEENLFRGLRMGFDTPILFFTQPAAVSFWIFLVLLIVSYYYFTLRKKAKDHRKEN